MVKVKICGIATRFDADACVDAGADAVGFLVGKRHASTSTFITAEEAAEIVRRMPPLVSTVLVTHLSRPVDVIDLAMSTKVSTAQLHGDTTPEEAAEIRRTLPHLKTYKVIHVTDESCIRTAHSYYGASDGLVLDTSIPATGQMGGTGKTHDWNISARLVHEVDLPVILAGGLTPENVVDAIRAVRPFAVDVNSGVSDPDGSKHVGKVLAFVRNAKLMAGCA